jgi:hypothetical protein
MMGAAMIDDLRRVLGRPGGVLGDVAGAVGLFVLLIAGLNLMFPV